MHQNELHRHANSRGAETTGLKFLKTLGDVLGELEMIVIKAFLLAILIHELRELYKIVAHH